MTRARDVANVLSTATSLATDTETAAAISSHATAANGHISYGNTAGRPASPITGQVYSNTQTGYMEVYTGETYGWEQIGGISSTVTGVTATNSGSGRAFNNGSASVAFTPGTILGRSYTVTSSPGGYTASGASSPITVTGLQSSTQYTYTVISTNNYGTSAASAASAGVTATTVPQAPTIGTATAGNASASVTFTAGATGGSAITSYTVTSSPGNITASGASSPITVTGLTNGTAYTFTVTATNANGTSAASSASSSVTPLATVSATALIVAGGGSAGGLGGGGGGGGVIPSQSLSFNYSTQYFITVGGPGGQIGPGDLSTNGVKGSNSSVVDKDGTYTAIGGGGGIAYASGSVPSSANGGSGGGGNNNSSLRGTGTVGQGNNGGFGGDSNISAAGGGGYSTSGSNGQTQAGGNGGQGYQLPSDIASLTAFSGMTHVGSGGGGGNRGSHSGPAGIGGTGAGNGAKGFVNGGNATSFGSGGGGGAQADGSMPISASGAGKDGVVVIKSSLAASSYTGSLQTANGFNYYVFTTSGSITF